jgi:hypothetical protein
MVISPINTAVTIMAKSIDIQENIYHEIEKRTRVAGFENVSKYVEYVLQQIIEKSKEKEAKTETREEKHVTEELRKAGYLE